MGWHLNRGAAAAAELVDASQIGEVFRRPDLVARALEADYPQLARTALADIGDLEQLLVRRPWTRSPGLARLRPIPWLLAGLDAGNAARLGGDLELAARHHGRLMKDLSQPEI